MTGRRSILYFTNSTLWGGAELHICGLLRKLSRRLFRPYLICDPVLYERFLASSPEDVEITPLAFSSPAHIAAAGHFARLLLRGRFEIVHAHMFWSSLFASPIAWMLRAPVIVETLHGTEGWRKGWRANWIVDRATTRFVSHYIAVCDSDARFLIEKKRVPANKVTIIPNGVDLSRFANIRDARIAIRKSLGFSEADSVLILVARFHSGKGHRVLLEAMQLLLRSNLNAKLICLGEGTGESELLEWCRTSGIADSVRFVGYQPNIPEWLAAADINVLPSFYEGFPLTILEAMASGVPTVASQVGGIPEAIQDGVNGLLVPPGDPRKLADALSLLLRDPSVRKRFGQAARACVLNKFSLEQQVSSTENVYLNLCNAVTVSEGKQPLLLPPSDDPSRRSQPASVLGDRRAVT